MKPQPTIEELIASLRQVLPQAKSAWLYGSAARGELRPDSDLDVAVFLPATDRSTNWQIHEKAVELAAIWGRDVDLVRFQAVSPVLQKEILMAGRQLFVDDEDQVTNYELFAMSQYREYNERFATDFERIAQSGRVLE